MVTRTWQKHAFWENYQKDRITGILLTENGNKKTKQQLTVYKFNPDGLDNPDFAEIIEQIGTETLDKNTADRNENKEKEAKSRHIKEQQRKKQQELAELFESKLKAFEIDEIKNSINRDLKSRLRKSKNIIELQIYAQLIVKESLGL
tara:strand:- start:2147 stop:2587 length:441 start_codon:yes stop_codon:yes gene_type:complete